MASVRTTGAAGKPAFRTARVNSAMAAAIASSRPAASTISCAPYRFVPMPVAMPPLAATAFCQLDHLLPGQHLVALGLDPHAPPHRRPP